MTFIYADLKKYCFNAVNFDADSQHADIVIRGT